MGADCACCPGFLVVLHSFGSLGLALLVWQLKKDQDPLSMTRARKALQLPDFSVLTLAGLLCVLLIGWVLYGFCLVLGV